MQKLTPRQAAKRMRVRIERLSDGATRCVTVKNHPQGAVVRHVKRLNGKKKN